MNRLTFGIIAEVVFGAIDVALMLPLNFDDRYAFAAAFASFRDRRRRRYGADAASALGSRSGRRTPHQPSERDRDQGVAPILTTGIIGEAIIGWAAGRWAAPA